MGHTERRWEGVRFSTAASRVTLIAILATLASIDALAQSSSSPLPDALQPGAVRPDAGPRIPPTPPGPILEIPPLVERSLAAESGVRITVVRFELEDVRDLPQHGVFVSEVRQLLEQIVTEQPQGFTLGELETVANRVSAYYRQRGLILAKAVLPVQTVDAGVVRLQIVEGRLGQVLTEGNRLYSTATLARPFSHLLGEPVSQESAESALLLLTDYPGLTAFGTFQPGKRVGEADLLLRVPSEDRFNASVRADNYGSESTGLYQTRAQLHWNNPTGLADRLSLTVQQSWEPANNQFGSLDYEQIFNARWQGGAYYRANEFTVGGDFEEQEISGGFRQAGLFVKQIWLRSREANFSSQQEIGIKRSNTDRAGEPVNEDRLTVLKLSASYDSVDTRFGGLNYAGIEYSQGFNDLLGAMGDSASAQKLLVEGRQPSRQSGKTTSAGESIYAEGAFSKLLVFYSRLQNLTPGSSVLARTEFQYTNDLLVPMEQYAVGGADHVRGFASSHSLYDTGGLISLEYILQPTFLNNVPVPLHGFGGNWRWKDVLQFSLFYDHAIGQKIAPLPNEPQGTYQVSSLGAGVRFNIPNKVSSRIQFAVPLIDESTNEDDNAEEPGPRLWFDLTWLF